MTALADALGHTFAKPGLLRAALAHSSAGGGRVFERLEFLGDRVLALVVADMLYHAFPDADEGALAKRLTALVRRSALVEVAARIDLGRHLALSRGEVLGGGRAKPAILADALEAVIAALYLDGGLEAAALFIRRYWTPLMEAAPEPPQDAKTRLQEWAQARGRPLPVYRVLESGGPDHAPTFTVEVTVAGLPPARGQGRAKRSAEQAAAAALLASLEQTGESS